MPNNHVLLNCQIVNDGSVTDGDIRIKNGRIDAIGSISTTTNDNITDANGKYLFPGLIDDQVHFREPGLTHKADIASESRAAVAGGVTSFMEMPNVHPPTLTMDLLEEKRHIAATCSLANYAFYLGGANDNIADIAAADPKRIAGIKVFMGASTGNMLVDNPTVLEKIFAAAPTLIATHCEDTPRINQRLEEMLQRQNGNISAADHARIRDTEACYLSSSYAVNLAKKSNAQLHVLHITTAKELALFTPGFTNNKSVTCEACVHHLLFSDADYETLGMRLKCNPAVKTAADRDAIRLAVANGQIDILATDHAPHLPAEKDAPYLSAAAGLPLVEYALPGFLDLAADGVLALSDIARAGAHRVAEIFSIQERGYIREGYFADLVLVEKNKDGFDIRPSILSKCGWTPFAGRRFRHRIDKTFVNGYCVFANDSISDERPHGDALLFNR